MPASGGENNGLQTQDKHFSDFVVHRATRHKIKC
jgi:hypothetical protein